MNPSPLTEEELARAARQAVRALPDAPLAWQQRAIGLFTAAPSPLVAVVQSGLRLLHAVLTFDRAAQPALAAGMRSVATDARHLLYSLEGRDIDLRITRGADGWQLAG